MGWERNHYRMEPAVSLMAGFFLECAQYGRNLIGESP